MSEEQPVLTKAQRREIPLPLTDEQRSLAQHIITELNEDNTHAWRQIEALVYYCGVEMAQAAFEETLKIESEGGLMVSSGRRRRTPGGVFLFLMASRVSQDIRREAIYLYQDKKEANKKKKKKPHEGTDGVVQHKTKAAVPLWDVYYEYLDELSAERGAATTVKITLIGRPGAVKINEETVTTVVEHVVKTSSLPKGVPQPPTTPTTYTVYIGLKQWRKVEAALQDNAEDAMIVEGVCAFDPKVQGMVVFATNATSKGLESAKRSGQASKPPREADGFTPIPVPATAEPGKYPVPPNVPPTVAQKLQDLYSAAEQFRNKLALLDTQPPDQRLGYAMTQKLLKNTEDQINALERQYK